MEIWKDIKGYEGMYQVSSLGRVKSLKRKGVLIDKILKNNVDSHGYFRLDLCKEGKKKAVRIHQLVAMVFLNHKPCGYRTIVDHIDNNKLNNNVDNLQLITVRENTSKDRKGGTSEFIGVSWNKPRSKWVANITIDGMFKYLGAFNCEVEASEAYQKELNKINNQ